MMGFFDEVLNTLGKAVNAVMYAAGTVVGIGAAGVIEFTQVACEKYCEFKKKNRSANLNLSKENTYYEVKEINDQILELEAKKHRDKNLCIAEILELHELCEKRDSAKENIRTSKEMSMAHEIQQNPDSFGSINLNDQNSHILQFHVGQTIFGKKCSQCGRPMVLQWRQGMATVPMASFFWGCIGFYEGIKHYEPFKTQDMDLFTKTSRPEFELSTESFSKLVMLPGPKNSVIKKMDSAKHTNSDTYLCPIHNEPMILKEKKYADGLLDQYFFGCPRWQKNGQGCNQIVKLKSPAQLASALEAFYGRGIL